MSNSNNFNLDKLKNNVTNTAKDMVSNLLYYNRKEDEELNIEQIEFFFKKYPNAVDFVVDIFKNELAKQVESLD